MACLVMPLEYLLKVKLLTREAITLHNLKLKLVHCEKKFVYDSLDIQCIRHCLVWPMLLDRLVLLSYKRSMLYLSKLMFLNVISSKLTWSVAIELNYSSQAIRSV